MNAAPGPASAASVAVVGAGPAGLAAAFAAAEHGARVLLFDRNPEPGRKLLLTGGGRCNVTNAKDIADFIPAYFGNGRFLHPAFRSLSNLDTIRLFENLGVPLKKDDEGKLFPRSDTAADIRDALVSACRTAGVVFRMGERVLGLDPLRDGEDGAPGYRLKTDRERQGIIAAAVVIATGGLSWPATGSTGDGLRWAERLGIGIVPPRPGLAPLTCTNPWIRGLAGVSVDPVRAELVRKDRDGQDSLAGKAEGPLLFTHRGISGPAVLRLSRNLPKPWAEGESYRVRLNLLPGTGGEELDRIAAGRFAAYPRRDAANALEGLLPASLLQAVVRLHSGGEMPKAGVVTREQRREILRGLQAAELTVARPASYGEAMVTAGGIALSDIDPRTMGVRAWPGLHAAGEVLDIDGDTGGYNLQAAFSTGTLAGLNAAASALRDQK